MIIFVCVFGRLELHVDLDWKKKQTENKTHVKHMEVV